MARNHEVLLRDNVKDLGKCGDLVKVSPGYARNFLLPKRMAIHATDENKKAMLKRRSILDVEESKRDAEIDARVAVLAVVEVKTVARADDHGHLFGSVNAATIVELLRAAGHVYEEKAVRLDNPLKEVGTYPVKLHIHGDRYAEIKVIIEAEEKT